MATTSSAGSDAERVLAQVWRQEAPRVLAALLRRHGDLGDCEDAAQEAAEAAVVQWSATGVPGDPGAWLVRVASRRLIDRHRSDRARERREIEDSARESADAVAPSVAEVPPSSGHDDTLRMLFLCCHPSLSRPSQVALSLRAVAGLSVESIAAAYLVPARTMTQRLTRARSALRAAGARFEMPSSAQLPARTAAVLDACHLMFTEGYTQTSGDTLLDLTLAEEAIRLVRQVREVLVDHDEASGLLALMLLTHARSPARTDEAGDLVPLAEQDRGRWREDLIDEGVSVLEQVLPRGAVGRYQLHAAIAAVHAEATAYAATDWWQIRVLYEMLTEVAPSPAVALNRAVAVAMTDGPAAGLAVLGVAGPAMARHHRWHAVRAHLLELDGDLGAAAEAYRQAARLTSSRPEQRYLNRRLLRLDGGSSS
ncbi:RNA polymerase sigma factor [Nocardioides sp.]|uniref:RNA polymerase sigma factor n=1 Tax=Nocardioides sp. TaxID=35761 RepID=UPI00273627DD|nr:sigma-70 family RNA polymerase sigma factor [Nocardioides sp.]MDP3889994.1 sigma-70 family RNA polymerase sigma factor [Nocardioides sp.]